MARTCPASSVNATIRAGLSAFDAACQQRGAKRTARERSGNAAESKPRTGKYGSDGSTTRPSPKSSSGGFFSARRLLRCRTMSPLASIASRIASRSQPAWHLTASFPSRSSLTPHDAVLSSCAGQRKSCQPDAEARRIRPRQGRSLSQSINGCCSARLPSRASHTCRVAFALSLARPTAFRFGISASLVASRSHPSRSALIGPSAGRLSFGPPAPRSLGSKRR